MHDCASILDTIAKGISLFPHVFRMVHPIPTSPFIQLNDFCTCEYVSELVYVLDMLGGLFDSNISLTQPPQF